MTSPMSLEQVAALAAQLPPPDRLRLVKRIARDLASTPAQGEPSGRHDWMSLRGIAPNLLGGEDAQAWVARNRREADEHRQQTLRRQP
jgi:hypothetical protein